MDLSDAIKICDEELESLTTLLATTPWSEGKRRFDLLVQLETARRIRQKIENKLNKHLEEMANHYHNGSGQ